MYEKYLKYFFFQEDDCNKNDKEVELPTYNVDKVRVIYRGLNRQNFDIVSVLWTLL